MKNRQSTNQHVCPACGRAYNTQALVNVLVKKGYNHQQIRDELFTLGLLLTHKNPLASVHSMVKRAKNK